MTRPAGSRLARLLVGAAALLASGTAVAACAASAGDLARASCAHVTTSISLYERAMKTADPAESAKLKSRAYIELLAGIPIAAQAAYHDIQWQSLSTTLSEANRVPESALIPALSSQCHAADSSVFGQVPPPTSQVGATGG